MNAQTSSPISAPPEVVLRIIDIPADRHLKGDVAIAGCQQRDSQCYRQLGSSRTVNLVTQLQLNNKNLIVTGDLIIINTILQIQM